MFLGFSGFLDHLDLDIQVFRGQMAMQVWPMQHTSPLFERPTQVAIQGIAWACVSMEVRQAALCFGLKLDPQV